MGSDFFMTYVMIDEDKEPDWEAGKRAIEKLLETHVLKWPSSYVDEYLSDWLILGEKTEADPDMNDRITHSNLLKQELDNLKSAWEGNFRDCDMRTMLKKKILFTGGMSWGDPPTDTFETIHKLDAAEIIQACGLE